MKLEKNSPLVPGKMNHDEAGRSQSLGINGLPGAYRSFVEDLRKRAGHPLRESPEYRQALADCVAAHYARKKPGHHACSGWEWNPRLLLAGLALIVLCGILWMGCRAVETAGAALDKHISAISVEAPE